MKANKNFFPACQLSITDYLLGGALLVCCYFSFFQEDIYSTGWNALNYLYENPLDFYENCKKIQGHGVLAFANYPPSLFALFALWLYPFKLLGVIQSPFYFSYYLVYWLKVLTSLVYIATGLLFYRVTQIYYKDKAWGTYATWLWLTTPLALFSQFIFSQYDIFYVFLTLAGFLFFLKKNSFLASFVFGLAITFKYFPFFVFVPLLLYLEKNIVRLIISGLIFSIPILLIQAFDGHSPAYISGVMGFSALGRVFLSALEVSRQKIYYIFALFTLLAGVAYYLDVSENYKKVAAYLFLFSSVFPFLFIAWHPQWLIFITPAVVLTTLMNTEEKIPKLLILDLFGMFFFIAYVVLVFQDNVDLAMFRSDLLHIPFEHSQNMGSLFKLFKGFSANVYLSMFWAYLVLQLILKYRSIFTVKIRGYKTYLYSQVRLRYYVGIFIFLFPAMLSSAINYINMRQYIYVLNLSRAKVFGELTLGRTFDQTFVAKGSLKQVDLFLGTFSRINREDIQLEIFDSSHRQLAVTHRSAIGILDNAWESFKFSGLKLQKGKTYLLRLSSAASVSGNAITWWAAEKPSYANGFAIVDGVQQHADFTFRLKFATS